jgi:hypothetical protein
MLAMYPHLCRLGLAEYSLLYFFQVLVQPFLQLKKVRRCEAQLGHILFFYLFMYLPFKLLDKRPSQALELPYLLSAIHTCSPV